MKSTRPIALVGQHFLKEFAVNRTFLGKIVYFEAGLYRMDYKDGDFEDLDSWELRNIIIDETNFTHEMNRRKNKLERVSCKGVKTSMHLSRMR